MTYISKTNHISDIQRFPIGTRYYTGGKDKRLCTVVDFWRIYNSRDELVSYRYVATHEFMGQMVTEYDVVDVTIAKGIIT